MTNFRRNMAETVTSTKIPGAISLSIGVLYLQFKFQNFQAKEHSAAQAKSFQDRTKD